MSRSCFHRDISVPVNGNIIHHEDPDIKRAASMCVSSQRKKTIFRSAIKDKFCRVDSCERLCRNWVVNHQWEIGSRWRMIILSEGDGIRRKEQKDRIYVCV